MSTLTSNIQQVKASPGCVTIYVQYKDGYPRSDAFVLWRNTTEWQPFGVTNESGIAIRCDYLAPGVYQASAWYPDLGTKFGEDTPFTVNTTGDGSATITADYEITPPEITILSPENTTYSTTSIDLNYTIYDFSAIDWTGYSLDGAANVTITGNTTLTGLSYDSHNIIVYANDTYGNMGSSDRVYFTVKRQYTLTIQTTTGGTTDPSPGDYQYTEGTVVTVTAIPSSGYEFDYWILDSVTKTKNPIDVTMDANHTITAYFAAIEYILTIETTTGGTTDPAPGTYTHPEGASVVVTAIPDSGYEFDYWKLDGTTRTENPIDVLMDSDHTLTAYFSESIHDIAITNITFSNPNPSIKETIHIYVTVENRGNFTEVFDLSVNYTRIIDPLINTTTITLEPGEVMTINFTWTPDLFGRYEIKAYTSEIPGDVNKADNTKTTYIYASSSSGHGGAGRWALLL